MKKVFSFAIALFVASLCLTAQNSSSNQFGSNYRGLVYNKEFTMDARVHTNGFALAANFTKIKTYYKSTYFHLEFGDLKHPKEYRQNSDAQIVSQGTPQSFVFGKENALYAIRAGYGMIRYYSEKARRKGVSIGINYEGGATLGLLKPYYLDIRQTDISRPGFIPTNAERFNPNAPCDFLDPGKIYGSSGFFKGLGEVAVRPGLHGKVGVHFDWGAFDEFVKAIEAGIMIDVFFQKVPHMIHINQDIYDVMDVNCPHLQPAQIENNPNRQIFLNLYVALHLGKRS